MTIEEAPKSSLTPKVGAISERIDDGSVSQDNVHRALADEEHLGAVGAVLDDDVLRLEDFKVQPVEDIADEVLILSLEEGHRCDQ